MSVWNNLASIPAEKWLTYIVIGYTLVQAFVFIRKEFFKRKVRQNDDQKPRKPRA